MKSIYFYSQLSSVVLVLLLSACTKNTSGESQQQPTHATVADTGLIIPNSNLPKNCHIFEKRGSLKLVPKNWGLMASGVDLLIQEKAFEKINYSSGLGIVDSGLRVSTNKYAGANLQSNSPESEDFSFHGTHVAGIASSSAYGVNKNLPTRAFAVPSIMGSMNTEDVIQTARTAFLDPSTNVYNFSMTFLENPQLIDLVKEATSKGKWVVFAAGNSDMMFTSSTAGQSHFFENAGLFLIGSSSYFGAPSKFSNFGPQISFYAPGTSIESLNGGLSPSLFYSKESVVMSGTSMAAPHAAALLATLRNLNPNVSAKNLREIFFLTNLSQGTGHKAFPFLNAYLTFKLLEAAPHCVPNTMSFDCFKNKLQEIQQSVPMYDEPNTSKCEAWTEYYENLKRGYFMSKGDDKYTTKIRALLAQNDRPIAENFIFNKNNADKLNLLRRNKNLPGIYRAERKRALNFFTGGLEGLETPTVKLDQGDFDELDNLVPNSSPRTGLDVLLPLPENGPTFLGLCPNLMETYQYNCEDYLKGSPELFKKWFLDHIVKTDAVIKNINVLKLLKPLTNQNEYKFKFQTVIDATYDSCALKADCNVEFLERLFDLSDSEYVQKKKIAELISKVISDQDDYKSKKVFWEIISHLDIDSLDESNAHELDKLLFSDIGNYVSFRIKEETLEPSLNKSIHSLRYHSLKSFYGLPSPLLADSLRSFLENISNETWAANRTVIVSFLERALKRPDPKLLGEITSIITQGKYIQPLHDAISSTSEFHNYLVSFLSHELLAEDKKISGFKNLLAAIDLETSVYMSPIPIKVLQSNLEIPFFSEYEKNLLYGSEGEKRPQLKMNYLADSSSSVEMTPKLKLYIESMSAQNQYPNWIFEIHPRLVRIDQKLSTLLNNRVSNLKDLSEQEQQSVISGLQNFVSRVETKSYEGLQPQDEETVKFVSNLFLKNFDIFLSNGSPRASFVIDFVRFLSGRLGENSDIVGRFSAKFVSLVENKSLNTILDSSKLKNCEFLKTFDCVDTTWSVAARSLMLLYETKSGRKLLAKSPIWSRIADVVRDPQTKYIKLTPPSRYVDKSEGSSMTGLVIHPALVPPYIARLNLYLDQKKDAVPENEYIDVIYRNPELTLPLIKKINENGLAYKTSENFLSVIFKIAQQSPAYARYIKKHTQVFNWVFGTSSWNKRLDLLLDYE